MKNFHIVLLSIFGFFIVLAILVFAGFLPSPIDKSQQSLQGKLILWGTEDSQVMSSFIDKIITASGQEISVAYKKKNPDTLADDLTEALASGAGPDLVMLPQDLIVRMGDKVMPFTPVMYPERDFKNAFIENGEIFITPKGILALPLEVDPLVMYWNRDMFTTKNLTMPPRYWDEFLTVAPLLTEKNETNDITQSAIAFGEFENVSHAKEILSSLILQTGNPIIRREGEKLTPMLSGETSSHIPNAGEVFRFYTDFADPAKKIYSWNRSLPMSKDAFLGSELAVYFGFSSEFNEISTKNPNLNFDVAPMPQIRDFPRTSTFGNIKGLAVLAVSKQPSTAIYIAKLLTAADASQIFSDLNHTPSPSRYVLTKTPSDPYFKIFADSAIISHSWLDTNVEKTTDIFRNAVESINSGKITAKDVIGDMQARMNLTLPKKK